MEEQIKEILFNPVVGKIASVILGIGLIWFIIKTIQKNLLARIRDNDNRYRAKKFSVFTGYLLTIVLITIIYSDKLGGLTVALGVAGAGIAFALQEVIVSFAGWLAIVFGKFYKTGDRIQLGGVKGDVMDIGVLRTTIMEIGQWVDGDLYNGRIVFVANSFVFKEPLYNYSGDFPFLWDEIKIPIAHGSNLDQVKQMLLETAEEVTGNFSDLSIDRWMVLQKQYLLEDAQTSPLISLIANENWVEFTLRYVVNLKKRRSTKTELFTRLLQKMETTHGDIKFASSTIRLVETPEINIKVKPN